MKLDPKSSFLPDFSQLHLAVTATTISDFAAVLDV